MKKIYTLLAFAVTVLAANAQTNPTKNDPAAKAVLDKVSAKFKTYKSPQASFTYQVENAQGKVLSTKKGTVVMQVKGGKEVTLVPGQTFYESPTDIHTVSKNGSSTKPAKILVFFVKNAGAPATVPAQ